MKYRFIVTMLVVMTTISVFSQDQSRKLKKQTTANEKGLVKVSIFYPLAEGKTFDINYYETTHMPMVAGFLGSNLVKYTIEKGIAGNPETPPAYAAIGVFYVKSLSEYQAAIDPNIDAIRADFPNYTNIIPVIFISEVVR